MRNSDCSDNGDGGDYASGIYLEEDTVGTIQNCLCNNNLIDGISTHDNAQLTLANNTCNYNGEDGITFSEYVTGTISNCECSYNSSATGSMCTTTRTPWSRTTSAWTMPRRASGSATAPPGSSQQRVRRQLFRPLRRLHCEPHHRG